MPQLKKWTLTASADPEAHKAYVTLLDPTAGEDQWLPAYCALESAGVLQQPQTAEKDAAKPAGDRWTSWRNLLLPLVVGLVTIVAAHRVFLHLGEGLLGSGSPGFAKACFGLSCWLLPLDASSDVLMAKSCNQLCQFDEAEQWANKALLFSHHNSRALLQRGFSRAKRYRLEEAIADFDQVDVKDGFNPEDLVEKAHAQFALQRYDDAQPILEQASGAHSNDPVVYDELSTIASSQSALAQALSYASVAIVLEPNSARYAHRGGLYELLQSYRLAQSDWQRAADFAHVIESSPMRPQFDNAEESDALCHESLCYFRLGQYSEAYTAALLAVRATTSPTETARIQRGVALCKLGRYEEALSDLRAYSGEASLMEPFEIAVAKAQCLAQLERRHLGNVSPNIDMAQYTAKLHRRLKKHWLPGTASGGLHATVFFYLQSDGQVTDICVVMGSGSPAFDLAALQAIEQSAPFLKLPKGLPEKMGVLCNFDCPHGVSSVQLRSGF
jgi:TonB family protein